MVKKQQKKQQSQFPIEHRGNVSKVTFDSAGICKGDVRKRLNQKVPVV